MSREESSREEERSREEPQEREAEAPEPRLLTRRTEPEADDVRERGWNFDRDPSERELGDGGPEGGNGVLDHRRMLEPLPGRGVPVATTRGGSSRRARSSRLAAWVGALALAAGLIALLGYFYARHQVRAAAVGALPQLDGSLTLAGLSEPVKVLRDAQGVPHLRAASVDDLVLAQGFVTAQDRLFQMDLLRRHAAGELAALFGPAMLAHDRMQRTLMIRRSAEATLAQLPPDQVHLLEVYARGVNAEMAAASQAGGQAGSGAVRLPVEFSILHYRPAPWTPRDSVLVAMMMFQNLTDGFAAKLAREELTERLNAPSAAEKATLLNDLYPVGSWRDHPPSQPVPDLTNQTTPFLEIPLDSTQSRLAPAAAAGGPTRASILAQVQALIAPPCEGCTRGSNEWAVSGAHTASGKPLLANDMHLSLELPDIWYEADLEAASAPGSGEPLHVAGVSLPGLPLIVVGQTRHIAWGFTNLGADVQDVYIEHLRGSGGGEQFEAVDGSWQAVDHLPETIVVRGARDVSMEVTATRHGDALTPILDPVLMPGELVQGGQRRSLSLRWTLNDPAVVRLPMLEIASARDWTGFVAAFSSFGGPTQNVVYADDQGHIGYHAVGRIPLRGPAPNPAESAADSLPPEIATPVLTQPAATSPAIRAVPDPLAHTAIASVAAPVAAQLSGPISPVPLVDSPAHAWTGYIPYAQLPQVYDPPGGVLATANARVTPENYSYPVALDWVAPYRNERIWHLLAHRTGLTPADMLRVQTDTKSEFDRILAQRLAYAIDHASGPDGGRRDAAETRTLHQAADLLRNFDGSMAVDSPGAAIVYATHAVLWPMLLRPKLAGAGGGEDLQGLYVWGERDFALEELLEHMPPRWLPAPFTNWNDLLGAAVLRGLAAAHAPADLNQFVYGSIHKVEIEHPLFGQYAVLRTMLGRPAGTGALPQSGDTTTIKQVGRSFGPSERFTADLADPDASTLNLVLGESGDPMSPWFLDQFPAWYHGSTFALPFTDAAVARSATHSLTLTP